MLPQLQFVFVTTPFITEFHGVYSRVWIESMDQIFRINIGHLLNHMVISQGVYYLFDLKVTNLIPLVTLPINVKALLWTHFSELPDDVLIFRIMYTFGTV